MKSHLPVATIPVIRVRRWEVGGGNGSGGRGVVASGAELVGELEDLLDDRRCVRGPPLGARRGVTRGTEPFGGGEGGGHAAG